MPRITIARVAVSLVLAAIGSAWAGEGRIPIFESTVLNGNLADISGRYVVTRNIAATSPAVATIQIIGTGTETIDIDLNGFTLSITTNPQSVVYVDNVRDLTIRGGSLIGPAGSDLLVVVGNPSNLSDKLVVEDLRLSGGGKGMWVFSTENLVLRNNVLSGMADRGIVLQGALAEPPLTGIVESNIFRGLAGSAFSIDDSSANVLIRNNQAEDVGGLVFFVDASRGTHIEGNTVSGDGVAVAAGIMITNSTGCIISENSVSRLGNVGIILNSTDACRVEGNVVTDSDSGLLLDNSSGNLLLSNLLFDNAFIGLWLAGDSDRNKIDGNTLTENTNYGLRFDATADDNAYRGNLARANGGAGCPMAGGPTCGDPDFCDAGSGNTSLGDNLLPGPPPC